MDSGRHYEEIYKECVLPSPCWMVYREALLICGAFSRDVYPEDYDLVFPVIQTQDSDRRFGKRCSISGAIIPTDYAQRQGVCRLNFLSLKLSYFLRSATYQPPLVIWGASTAKEGSCPAYASGGIHFHWVCNTPSKWGKIFTVSECKARQSLNK